jgi:hypothetical protein
MEPENQMNNNQYQAPESQPMFTQSEPQAFTPEPKKKGGKSWVWIIVILIIAALAWLFFGAGDTEVEDFSNPDFIELAEEGVAFDENGLPILGPDAPISSVEVLVSESFPVQVGLVTQGELPNGCTYLNSPSQTRDGNTFYVNLSTRTEGEVCTEALVPYERNVSLNVDGLPAGTYSVVVNGEVYSFDIAQDNTLNFEAGSDK